MNDRGYEMKISLSPGYRGHCERCIRGTDELFKTSEGLLCLPCYELFVNRFEKENYMSVLEKIQREHPEWAEKNFGERPFWQPLLGVGEEVGELYHAVLKREQGIRIDENHREDIKDSIADIIIFLCDFANSENINITTVLEQTWKKVKERDWNKNKQNGV